MLSAESFGTTTSPALVRAMYADCAVSIRMGRQGTEGAALGPAPNDTVTVIVKH